MKLTRRGFLGSAVAAAAPAPAQQLDGVRIARRHRIVRDIPSPNFFEGMLLGNGDIGLCVTVRPDALGLHIGKEDSWDIRVSEDHYPHVLHFKDLLELWRRASEEAKRRGRPDMLHLETNIEFFREYTQRVRSSYAKPWPRPWPCGIVWIHWDSRMVRLVRQVLDISEGLLTLDLEHDDLRGSLRRIRVLCFVNQETGHISVSTREPAPFLSVAYYPYTDREARLPSPELRHRSEADHAEFVCVQRFPAIAPTDQQPDPPPSPEDRSFALCGRLHGEWKSESGSGDSARVFLASRHTQTFRLDLTLFTTRDDPDNVNRAPAEARRLATIPVAELQRSSAAWWRTFWSRSAVEFADRELERIWYHNQYWLACCLREGKVAPGLFGNWTSGRIGTAWHGDYHMNYNTQQVYWGVFSSNHVEQHLPYVELCENLLPIAESFAREKFSLPGAFFPHSAYPVPSKTIAYPVPPWGYEVCETPWTVQSLWWHYLYTLDEGYLRRAYPLLRAAARFLAAYMTKGEDGYYHVIPTVSPENWGFTVDFRLNRDCIMDLALARFVFKAAAEAARILKQDSDERRQWLEIESRVAPYPKARGPFGEVWIDVVDAPTEYVYNIPVTLAPVFPGEQVGLDTGQQELEIARRTARTVRLEGGNDLVFQPLIRARLGMLDLDWFKQEVRYCLLPNGVAQDRVRQIGGRYRDTTDFDFMMRMGIWVENLSLPAVLNECLMQSYSGVIRLFPNTRNLGRARFHRLRAVGAFLISASWDGKQVGDVQVYSEKGATARVVNPWPGTPVRVITQQGSVVETSERKGVIEFATQPGETYYLQKSSGGGPQP
jgi:alpha-L-fucosidase 2